MKINRNKLRSLCSILFSLILVITCFTGCENKSKKLKKGEIYLYYTDKKQTQLKTVTYKPKEKETIDIVNEVLKEMNKTSKELNVITAKPDNVSILECNLTENILEIDFDATYLEMSKVTELLCRSAIVLTVTQIEGVEFVIFTVNGEPLLDSDNTVIGTMKSTDFVDTVESNLNSYEKVTIELYFGNSDGKTLSPVVYEGIRQQNTSVEKLIIEKLIEGPSSKDYVRTLPSNLKLTSVITKDGICYVNFDSTFLTEVTDVSAELEIYSIVNSLSELSYINKVQISVNGVTDKKLRDEISLEYPFTRNLDVVKMTESEGEK